MGRDAHRLVADIPPRETSPAAKSEEKRMFSQAKISSNEKNGNNGENDKGTFSSKDKGIS